MIDDQNTQRPESERGQNQGAENNPGNFSNRSKEDIDDAARKGGEA